MSENETKPQDETTAPAVVEVEILESESFINNALTKFDANKAEIAQAKIDATALTIAGIEDKEGYKYADRKRKDLKQRRLAIAATEKELIEKPKKFIEAVKAYARPLQDDIKAIEAIIQVKTDAIDKLQEEADRIEAERRQTEFLERTNHLLSLGLKFNGSVYALGNCILLPSQIQSASDEMMDAYYKLAEDAAETERINKEAEEAKERELAELRAQLAAKKAPENFHCAPDPAPTERVNGTPKPNIFERKLAEGSAVKLPPPVQETPPHFTAPITHPTDPGAANIATDPTDEPKATTAPAELPSAKAWKALNIPVSPNTPHMKSGFAKGWDAALDAVLAALNSPEIKTRGDIKASVTNLKIK